MALTGRQYIEETGSKLIFIKRKNQNKEKKMKKLMLHKADSQDQIYEHTRDGSYGEDHATAALAR